MEPQNPITNLNVWECRVSHLWRDMAWPSGLIFGNLSINFFGGGRAFKRFEFHICRAGIVLLQLSSSAVLSVVLIPLGYINNPQMDSCKMCTFKSILCFSVWLMSLDCALVSVSGMFERFHMWIKLHHHKRNVSVTLVYVGSATASPALKDTICVCYGR